MSIDFTIGRGDFSVTVYVPWNCTNNCKFCSSKKDYEVRKSDFLKLKESLQLIRESILPIVVFTGGEPSADIDKLKELLSIVDNKTVYINTSLPKKNCESFIELVNTTDCVESISISRHKHTYEEDLTILSNIAEDEMIAKITKPVRINVVSQDDNTFSIESVEKYVERWSKIAKLKGGPRSLILNLRGDYCKQDRYDLHELTNNKIVNDLAKKYHYHSHIFCNVCDTCNFEKLNDDGKREFIILYHRGLMNTTVKFADVVELNDLIIFQNGDICYDWNGEKNEISTFMNMIKRKKR